MIEQIRNHQSDVARLCREYCVRRLELFGSAAAGGFDADTSDLDFLVEFEPESSMGPFRQYIDFQLALEELFRRPVDLVEAAAVRNQYFQESLDNGPRALLYAA